MILFLAILKRLPKQLGKPWVMQLLKRLTRSAIRIFTDLKFLFVGSPTRAFQPTPAIKSFLKGFPSNALEDVNAAAFDTRIPKDQTESGFLKFMINLFGYADKKIEKQMENAGATIKLESEGFGVTGTEGPLAEGEIERAKAWAKRILE